MSLVEPVSPPPVTDPAPSMPWYGFHVHPEPDAPEALRRFLGMMGWQYTDQFTPDEFRRFRDGLSACGVDLREIETWTETERRTVL